MPIPAQAAAIRSRRSRALTVALLLLSCACRDEAPHDVSRGSTRPVLLVGMDGLEREVVARLMDAGRMPTFRSLARRGVFGELAVTKPTLSPIVWTSIATGVGSRKHGILGFVHGAQQTRGERGEAPVLYTGNDRRVKAFWNILSDAGRRVHTIGWWLTYPAEPVNGVMVAQVNTITPAMRRAGQGVWKGRLVEGLTGQVHPPEREPSLLALLPRVEAETRGLMRTVFGEFPAHPPPVPAAMLEQSEWAFRADSLYHRVALDVAKNDAPFDLLAVYFGGADVVGHRFWRHAHPEAYRFGPDPSEQRLYGRVLEDYYAYLDAVLASLLDAVPADANVLIVSDHGMSPIRLTARFRKPALSGGHLTGPPAFFLAAGPDIRAPQTAEEYRCGASPRRVGSILDVTPTVLALLDVPVGRDMDGEPMTSVLSPKFLAEHPVRSVARHTETGWYESRPKPNVQDPGAPERVEQLRALGYLAE
jgi:hypothetical protein